MKIYIIRHGDSLSGIDDDLRPLSDLGKKDLQKLSQFLSRTDLNVDKILHSEKLRAKQTAEIIATGLKPNIVLESKHYLDPLADITPLIEEIGSTETNRMIVGHMPFLGKLVSYLLTKNEMEDIVAIKSGSILCLENISLTHWVLRWMLIPELFD